MSKNKIIIISDVHIGSNARTNWYQDSIHRPFLECALKYVRDNSEEVQELILLGDLVDQWMYVPDIKPPSFEEIKAQNPYIFGGTIEDGTVVTGALVETANALGDDRTVYLNGNHDMMISPEEISSISPKIQTAGIVYKPPGGKGQVVCTHGHIYSIFCAPDVLEYPPDLKGLPLGHFVSRLASRWCLQKLEKDYPPNATSANMPGSGNPNGAIFDEEEGLALIEDILKWITKGGDLSLSKIVMDGLLKATGNVDKKFILRNGSHIDAADVPEIYSNVYTDYPKSTGLDEVHFGMLAAEFALGETDSIKSLSHFAAELAETHRIVALGHTHAPVDKDDHFILYSDALYVNSGFVCPSIPDMKEDGKMPSFTEIEIDEEKRKFIVSVKKVVSKDNITYQVENDKGPKEISFK